MNSEEYPNQVQERDHTGLTDGETSDITEKKLISGILLDYCSTFNSEIDRIQNGVFSKFDESIRGRDVDVDELLSNLYKKPGEDEKRNLNLLNIGFLLALVPPLLLPHIFLEVILAEVVLTTGYLYVRSLATEAVQKAELDSYIRLRDATPLINICADMQGFIRHLITDKKYAEEDSPIVKKIDDLYNKLTTVGGYLSIYTIQQIRYQIKQIEGLAYLLTQAEVTIDDIKESMFKSARHRRFEEEPYQYGWRRY